ncbi:MAG: hypothetical protein V3S89_10780 [Desulfobacterales bacterium]
MKEQEQAYSVAREIRIVFGLGISIGLIILIGGVGFVEFLKG